MYVSEAGGCCDCGDPHAWHPSGFCRRHREGAAADPPQLSAQGAEAASIALSQGILEMTIAVLEGTDSARPLAHVTPLFQELEKAAAVPALRTLVCAELLRPLDTLHHIRPELVSRCRALALQRSLPTGVTPLEMFFHGLYLARRELVDSLVTTLLLCAYAAPFKVACAHALIPLYARIAGLGGQPAPAWATRALDRVTVHLFLMPEIALQCVREGMAGHLLDVLDGWIRSHVRAGGSHVPWPHVDAGAKEGMQRSPGFSRIRSDLRMLLSHEDCARHLLETPGFPERTAEILQSITHARSLSRKLGAHVEFDNAGWLTGVVLEECLSELFLATVLYATGIKSELNPYETRFHRSLPPAALLSVARALFARIQRIPQHLGVVEANERPPSMTDRVYRTLLQGSEPATFQHPLHRIATAAIFGAHYFHSQRGHEGGVDASRGTGAAGPDPWAFADRGEIAAMAGRLGQDALKVLSWLAQLRARLWVLNGSEVMQIEQVSRTSYCAEEMLQWDYAALQLWLSTRADLEGPDEAVDAFMNAFGGKVMTQFAEQVVRARQQGSEAPTTSPLEDKLLLCYVDGLRSLLSCVRDALVTHEEPRPYARRHVVHILAAQDLAYSTLLERLPRSSSEVALRPHALEEVIREVTEPAAAEGFVGSAKLTLRKEAWSEMDPFWRLYHPVSQGEAVQRALALGGAAYDPLRVVRAPLALHPLLTGLPALLPTRALLLHVLAALRAGELLGTNAHDDLERAAVHLLAMALQRLQETGEGTQLALVFLRDEGAAALLAPMLRSLCAPTGPAAKDVKAVAAYALEALEQLVGEAAVASGGGAAAAAAPERPPGNLGDASVDEEAAAARQAMMERRAAMMRQLQQQQAAALEGLSDSDSDSGPEEGEHPEEGEARRQAMRADAEAPGHSDRTVLESDPSAALIVYSVFEASGASGPDTCCVCRQAGHEENPLRVLIQVHRNSTPRDCLRGDLDLAWDRPLPPGAPEHLSDPCPPPHPWAPSALDHVTGLHVHTCSHVMCSACVRSHQHNIVHLDGFAREAGYAHVDLRRGAITCPLCKRVANASALLPPTQAAAPRAMPPLEALDRLHRGALAIASEGSSSAESEVGGLTARVALFALVMEKAEAAVHVHASPENAEPLAILDELEDTTTFQTLVPRILKELEAHTAGTLMGTLFWPTIDIERCHAAEGGSGGGRGGGDEGPASHPVRDIEEEEDHDHEGQGGIREEGLILEVRAGSEGDMDPDVRMGAEEAHPGPAEPPGGVAPADPERGVDDEDEEEDEDDDEEEIEDEDDDDGADSFDDSFMDEDEDVIEVEPSSQRIQINTITSAQLLWPAFFHLLGQVEVSARPWRRGDAPTRCIGPRQTAPAVEVMGAVRLLAYAALNAEAPDPTEHRHRTALQSVREALRSLGVTAVADAHDGPQAYAELLTALLTRPALVGARRALTPEVQQLLRDPVLLFLSLFSLAAQSTRGRTECRWIAADRLEAPLTPALCLRAALAPVVYLTAAVSWSAAAQDPEALARCLYPLLARALLAQQALLSPGGMDRDPLLQEIFGPVLDGAGDACAWPVRRLLPLLGLPSLDRIIAEVEQLAGEGAIAGTVLTRPDPATPPAMPRLPQPPTLCITLPSLYSELYLGRAQGADCACATCGSQGGEKALCLRCGQLLCTAPCRKLPTGAVGARDPLEGGGRSVSDSSLPGFMRHAELCGNGLAMFLFLKSTHVVVVRDRGVAQAPSVYLDRHGEEDVNQVRGRPLHLQWATRLAKLIHMAETDSFDLAGPLMTAFRVVAPGTGGGRRLGLPLGLGDLLQDAADLEVI